MQAMETNQERVVALLHDVVEDSEYRLADIEGGLSTEIRDAVEALTKREGESYTVFIDRVMENYLVRRVKIQDIEDSMDLRRVNDVDEATLRRRAKYHRAWRRLRDVVDDSRK